MNGLCCNPAVVAEKFEKEVALDKQLRKDIDEIIQRLKDAVGSRERSLAITKLQEGGRSITTSARQVISLGTKLSKGKELNVPESVAEIGSDE